MASEDEQSKKPSTIMQIFANTTGTYERGSFDYQKNLNLIIDMLLNNMKIENQEVDKQEFLKSLDEQNAG